MQCPAFNLLPLTSRLLAAALAGLATPKATAAAVARTAALRADREPILKMRTKTQSSPWMNEFRFALRRFIPSKILAWRHVHHASLKSFFHSLTIHQAAA